VGVYKDIGSLKYQSENICCKKVNGQGDRIIYPFAAVQHSRLLCPHMDRGLIVLCTGEFPRSSGSV
jgi:hypothetical protein